MADDQTEIDKACDIIAGFIRIQGSDIFWPVRDGKEFLAKHGRDETYCRVAPSED